MAVSVLSAAGVVTTQKAAAYGVVPTIVVDWKSGAKYTYTPKQFNIKKTDFSVYQGTNIKHFEAATGGAAYSSISATQTQAAWSSAGVSTHWQLNLGGANWADVQNTPCKVTVKVNYHIQAKGNSDTRADAYWGPWIMGYQDTVYGSDPVHAKSAVTTTTWQGTVGDLFSGLVGGPYYAAAGAGVSADQLPAGAGQASAAITCSSIVLEFPAI